MDKALDEVVRERQAQRRGDRNRGSRAGNRRGVRKPERTDSYRNGGGNSKGAWVHDRYEEDYDMEATPRGESGRGRNGFGGGSRRERREGSREEGGKLPPGAARLKVENLHYELTQEDLMNLFSRIAPPLSLTLKYDRAGRSEGIAYVIYDRESYARRAIEEFDRANAHGQPIYLTLISTGNSNPAAGRSLFERVEGVRSLSPFDNRESSRVRPSGKGSKIDRYIPPDRDLGRLRDRERERWDRADRGDKRDGRSRGKGRRGGGGGGGGGERSAPRPKKTVEELDEEMSNYWNGAEEMEGGASEEINGAPSPIPDIAEGANIADEDMMIVE